MSLTSEEQKYLLSIAKQSIENGLEGSQADTDSSALPVELERLKNPGASFVTLNKDDQLRGCIGTLEAVRPLHEDVSHNAYNAAFRDPRFMPLTKHEVAQLNVGISYLTAPVPMKNVVTLNDLLDQLQPGEDGLIISEGFRRATFLPSVWEQLPDKQLFVQHLLRKAGISGWSEQIVCERYASFSFTLDWHEIEN